MNRYAFLPPVPVSALQSTTETGPFTEVTCDLDTWRHEYHLPSDFLRLVSATVEIGRKKRRILLVTPETIRSRTGDGEIRGVPTWCAIDAERRTILIFPTPIEPMVLRLFYKPVGMHGWLPKR